MREIHMHGELCPSYDTPSCFGAAGLSADDEEWTRGNRVSMNIRSFAARRVFGGFDVVRTLDMASVGGPFPSLSEAEDAASVLRMEMQAEKGDAKAIKAMAARAETAH